MSFYLTKNLRGAERKRKAEGELKRDRPGRSEEAMVACEIDVREKDPQTSPGQASQGSHLAQPEDVGEVQGGLLEIAITRIEEKKSFDEAQAIELSNVLNSAAVRGLSQSELAEVDFGKVMNMRWVMTWKATGQAKARLVVLGYQGTQPHECGYSVTNLEQDRPACSVDLRGEQQLRSGER